MTELGSGCRARGAFTFANQRVNAPAPWPVEEDEQKEPAIKYSALALVGDGEKVVRRVNHEVSHCHCATGDERSQARKQTKCDQESADKANPAAELQKQLVRSRHSPKHAEEQLAAVGGKIQTKDKPRNAVNRIRKSIQRIHGRQAERCEAGMSRTSNGSRMQLRLLQRARSWREL
jgi:hypothetical protein